MRRLFYLAVTLLCLTPVLAHGASHHHRNHYTICTLRKDHSEPKRCWRVPMPRHWKVPTGHHKNCSWDGSQWVCITWPTFKPKPQTLPAYHYLGNFPTTGYSWGCGTPNGITASGTYPDVGTIANDWLPFGTRVSIPSLGYSGVVLDRGQGHGGFDLFAPSCSATYAYTGYRAIYID